MGRYKNRPTVQFVLDEYNRAVREWASKTNDLFSWPDDALCPHKWQYWVHCRWVSDWNMTGREKDCVSFLLGWLKEDNILNAWADWDDWENENIILERNFRSENG